MVTGLSGAVFTNSWLKLSRVGSMCGMATPFNAGCGIGKGYSAYRAGSMASSAQSVDTALSPLRPDCHDIIPPTA